MKIPKFNYPCVHRHYFKVVLDGKCQEFDFDCKTFQDCFYYVR